MLRREARDVGGGLQAGDCAESFAEFTAISGIDLELPGGGVTAVIGPSKYSSTSA